MVETGLAPETMSGTTVLGMLEGKEFVLGKKVPTTKQSNKEVEVESVKKRKCSSGEKKNQPNGSSGKEKKPEDWLKKRSIFFKLPYWEHNKLRHNLDVMHLEKNVCENFIGTLLDILGKTKDGLNARLDLVELGVRENLHPIVDSEGKQSTPDAPFTMTRAQKEILCSVIQNLGPAPLICWICSSFCVVLPPPIALPICRLRPPSILPRAPPTLAM